MGSLEVDTAVLSELVARLNGTAAVAREVHDHRGSLESHLSGAGEDQLGSAVRSFLGAWAYGCGLLADDAGELAGRLGTATRLYVEVDASLARGIAGA
ncbi:MAG: type VII secretion target [Actinomycetota bacterium]|nr:type VII secretion target [Actinomycetota bacterium]